MNNDDLKSLLANAPPITEDERKEQRERYARSCVSRKLSDADCAKHDE